MNGTAISQREITPAKQFKKNFKKYLKKKNTFPSHASLLKL
jgi:mRNA-degrading endonuclease YafQ of YafQ-DinJ toxin-antitoxin module